jgi:hypothetical protein
MRMELAPRLNLITGDNGLGKSFLLDVAWWALTRRWPIELNRKMTSGYVARNYWKKRGDIDVQERLAGYVFSPKEVWDELKVDHEGRETIVCNGLVRDWASWIREKGGAAKLMEHLLAELSPSREPDDLLQPGPLVRISIDDPRDIPSLRTAYAEEVPILHASAGIRRITALAYMLLWSWREHTIAADRLGEQPTSRVVMLIDEIEAHLHPRWQRSILRSVLKLAGMLHEAEIQLIAATHSPLVLASAEPIFDSVTDAWFDLDLEKSRSGHFAKLRKREFVRYGDASAWLRSVAFDLKEARSIEAEQAISSALALARSPHPSAAEVKKVERLLRESLGDTDRFWMRWTELKQSLLTRRRRST